jgi:hypothetical protein
MVIFSFYRLLDNAQNDISGGETGKSLLRFFFFCFGPIDLGNSWVLASRVRRVVAKLSTKLAILSIGEFRFVWSNFSMNHVLDEHVPVGSS